MKNDGELARALIHLARVNANDPQSGWVLARGCRALAQVCAAADDVPDVVEEPRLDLVDRSGAKEHLRDRFREDARDLAEIGRAHVGTPVTWPSRMPSSA